MYLLRAQEVDNTGTLDVELELHVDNIPPYAILSHRWGSPADEPTFKELMCQTAAVKQKKGYRKLLSCCALALEYGLSYVWIDTCCIDKSSSAELSEAINSMYSWYEASNICFAYMEDVPPGDYIMDDRSAFRNSIWFTRGWTLQELIAPNEVLFFDSGWSLRALGSKSTLSELLSSITGIQEEILTHREKLHTASVAQKMCWASRRQTTRVEDEAYSLMGIFGVSMPTIYGEGRKAFLRLQEEIMKGSADHTIFAWDSDEDHEYQGMLAKSPQSFRQSGHFTSMSYNEFADRYYSENADLQPYYTMTNFGLQIQLPIVSMSPHFEGYYFSFLAAFHEDRSVIIFLRQRDDRPAGHFFRTHFNGLRVSADPCPN
ncbi:het domain protein [Colletotrichum kahawae]|uniref:Het domain protein n=1 Tax=Colletotrichum kahawae TaxID=34407 RepID=A0AAD9YN47_COLKA|nr:het domain protein [Colletotrichum kahawae]